MPRRPPAPWIRQSKAAVEIATRIKEHWRAAKQKGTIPDVSGTVTLEWERFNDGRWWARYNVLVDEAIPFSGYESELIALSISDWRSALTLYRRECRENVLAIRLLQNDAVFENWLTVFYEPEVRFAPDRAEGLSDLILKGQSLGPDDYFQAFEYVVRSPIALEKEQEKQWLRYQPDAPF